MSNDLQTILGKLEVTNEIGETLDKQLQHAENTTQQLAGGSASLRLGAVKVGELGAHVDKDLQEGKLSFESELVAAAYVKGFIRKASEVLLNLSDKTKSEELVSHGRVAAMKESLEIVKKHCVNAKARAEQIVAAHEELAKIEAGNISEYEATDRRNRLPGQHPGPSSLDDRRAERDAAKAAAEDAPMQSQDDVSAVPPAEVTSAPETVSVSDPAFVPPRVKRSYKRRQKLTEAP